MSGMEAMVLEAPRGRLVFRQLPLPQPGDGQLRLRVHACGVCRTDIHIADGEVAATKLPLVLGHQIVATVDELGPCCERMQIGDLVGVPWLGWTCGACRYCLEGRENLCDQARFTGLDQDGGYAETAVANERFCLPLPRGAVPVEFAPLLCGGLIGYRALRMTENAERVGLYGFGAAAHIISQVAGWQGRRVFAFTRRGDDAGQELARSLGAEWSGPSDEAPPEELDAAIIFAPVGSLVPAALRALAKGGVVVCAGIHMSDIPSLPYELLWGERVVRSVANLTRSDGEEFLRIAQQIPVRTHVQTFPLKEANGALDALRAGAISGAAVLSVSST
jgi:alcohol dehydrogenase, propanol-preferring